MTGPRLIAADLLDAVSAEARAAPRGRKNRNFHPADDSACHRLLNAIEPGSYVRPHRHLDTSKDEGMVILRGALGILWFTDDGAVAGKAVLRAGGPVLAADLPHGTWHTVVALEPGTVVYEAKAGPYRPNRPEEWAPFAPPEGDPGCAATLAGWEAELRR